MFARLGLSATTCASLARLGYQTPTPIQTEAIPVVLSGVDLRVPPLRERRSDIAELAAYFLARHREVRTLRLSDAARDALQIYDWPGNVRELENTCERIAQMCFCGTVRVGCVAANVFGGTGALPVAVPRAAPSGSEPISLDERLRALESELITWALNVSKGNKSRAAELLKIKRSTLGDRIRQCGLDRPSQAASSSDGPATPYVDTEKQYAEVDNA